MSKNRKYWSIGWLISALALSACAEFADVMLAELEYCYGCDWIIQEWNADGWKTHNSDPYESEEICEQALAEQSRNNPDRGHRCIYEEDLPAEVPASGAGLCFGCDWVVEIEEPAGWMQTDSAVHHNEGVCQQALWQLFKRNPERHFRCRNLDP